MLKIFLENVSFSVATKNDKILLQAREVLNFILKSFSNFSFSVAMAIKRFETFVSRYCIG